MLSILLIVAIGTLLGETSSVLVKKKKRVIKTLPKAFMMTFFSFLVSVGSIILKEGFYFEINPISIGIFLYLIIGLLGYKYCTLTAIEKGERSIMSLFGLISLPFLLLSDWILGNYITIWQTVGILYIVIVLAVIKFKKAENLNFKGLKWILFAQAFAFFNVSTFNRIIKNHTNVSSMIAMYTGVGTIIFGILTYAKYGKQGINQIMKKDNWLIGLLVGASGLVTNFAHYLGGGAIITVTKRVFAMFWGFLSGKILFKEEQTRKKAIILGFLTIGILIMNLGKIIEIF